MHERYFQEAAKVAAKARCHRAHCGSVIVAKDGTVIGVGYNAPPLDDESQRMCDVKYAPSKKLKSDKTCCVHAEWNAIIAALKYDSEKIKGATLYFMRVDDNGQFTDAGRPYCTVCSRLALQSGIETFGLWNGRPDMIDTATYNRISYNFHT